jgi:hypothetical protein
MRLVRANQTQRQKLKQLHWDAVRNADGMVWRDLASSTELDVDELERLFKLLDNKALKCVLLARAAVCAQSDFNHGDILESAPQGQEIPAERAHPLHCNAGADIMHPNPSKHASHACRKVARAPTTVQLIEGRRAHNVCIELSGIHMDMDAIKSALSSMSTDHIPVDALSVLQRAVPTPIECNEIHMYLAGKHPRYKGMSDPNSLGACERCAGCPRRHADAHCGEHAGTGIPASTLRRVCTLECEEASRARM